MDVKKSGVRALVVDPMYGQQRVDNFLQRELKGVPKHYIYRLVRTGQVRVNKGRVKPAHRLQPGDVVRVPPLYESADNTATPNPGRLQALDSQILLEDDNLLIINKPSGLAVHGGSGLRFGLIEDLRALRPHCSALELVHRLDRATSGCLLIAKKRSVLQALHALLRENRVEKTYWALLQGRWPKKKIALQAPLLKNVVQSGERFVKVSPKGKAALTVFKMLQAGSTASLVEAKPVTGRTHQIRVHAQHAGHPIAGDDKYGDADFDRTMKAMGLQRLFLHAESIRFQLPDGPSYHVSAALDARLQSVLEQLGLVMK